MNPATEDLLIDVNERVKGRFFGKYRGTVTDNNDPDKMGRIKANVPSVFGEEMDSGWAFPCVPFGGDGEGHLTLPSVGSRVWIEFEGGDISRPIWTGAWWLQDKIPKNESDTQAGPDLKVIRTKSGILISFDDEQESLTLSDKNGANMITVLSKDGKIKILGKTKVVVEAPAIELVEDSTHPLVFGDDLLNYLNQIVNIFNAHMHSGQSSPSGPVTPTPPQPAFQAPQQSMLSQKVKTG